MFLDPTVIVLGAGGSAEFGFPTGIGIFREVMADEFSSRPLRKMIGYEFDFLSSFSNLLRVANRHEELESFQALQLRLRQSHAQSIDLYAFKNPSQSEIAKLYTAWRLTKQHFRIETFENRYREQDFRLVAVQDWLAPSVGQGPERRTNWIGALAQTFTAGARTSADLAKNKLSVVTFNYDTVFEDAFPAIVRFDERFPDAPDEVMPKVLHVHGSLQPVVDGRFTFPFYLQQMARIKFISDTSENPPMIVDEAVSVLDKALRIYCVGFAFEEFNRELLQIGRWGGRAWALNFDGDVQVQNEIQKSGISPTRVWSGSDSKKWFLGTAASKGFFTSR